jgi:hypothetical protein
LAEGLTGFLNKQGELIVHILAKPAPTKIKWSKDNREMLIKDRVRVETVSVEGSTNPNLKEYRLLIDNLQGNDQGIYKIEATNKCGTGMSQTDYVVKGGPAFVRKLSDTSVVEKKMAVIQCEVTGLPIPAVEWYKDGVLVEMSDNVQMEVKNKVLNVLTIKSVTSENFGTYTVRAKNEIGVVECSAILNVDSRLF